MRAKSGNIILSVVALPLLISAALILSVGLSIGSANQNELAQLIDQSSRRISPSKLLIEERQNSSSHLPNNLELQKSATSLSKRLFQIQVTAIHVNRAEFPLSKLLFSLTLRLAMNVAEKKLESRRVKLSLNIRSANTCSGQFAAAIAAEEYYLKKSRLFIVSGCDDAIRGVSRLASGWNVPVMTAAGFGADLNDKHVHKTLIRVAFSLKTAVKFLIKLLKSFSWHRVNLIVDESDANSLALKDSIENHLTQTKVDDFQVSLNLISLDIQTLIATNVSDALSRSGKPNDDKWPNEITERAIHDSLKQSSLFSRVSILLIPQQYLRKFMLSVYDQNMANGLYTFINMPLLMVSSSEDQIDNSQAASAANFSKQSYTASTGDNVFIWRSLSSSKNSHAKQAFESLMSIYLKTPATKAYVYFASKLLNLANLEYSTTTSTPASTSSGSPIATSKIQLSINPYSASFYDCVQIFSSLLDESFAQIGKSQDHVASAGGNKTLSRKQLIGNFYGRVSELVRNKRFDNMVTGTISINENGDRETDYTLDDLNPLTGKYNPVILFKGESNDIERLGRIHWSSDETVGPTTDNVDCTLVGTCASRPWSKFLVTLVSISTPVGILMVLVLYFVYTRISLESQLVDYWWRINYQDIEILDSRRKNAGDGSSVVTSSQVSLASKKSADEQRKGQDGSTGTSDQAGGKDSDCNRGPRSLAEVANRSVTRTTTSGLNSTNADVCYGNICLGIHKLNKVALKPIAKFHQSRKLMIELRSIKAINHSNLCRFVGIVIDEPNMAFVNEFCPKGSLREFFQNESMVIDWTFKFSIMNDIMAGLAYLHSCEIGYHGRLKTSNCLVSSRFVVKLSDYGLKSLYEQLDDCEPDEMELLAKRLWYAPEHIRQSDSFGGAAKANGSPKGDVYSFGLLLYEIITYIIPFYNADKTNYTMPITTNYSAETLYNELKNNGISEKTGPDLSLIDLNQNSNLIALVELMRKCWHYDPNKRCSLQETNSLLKRITRGVTSKKLLENLTSRMEQYTNNLESLVEAKLATLIEEKSKAEELLYQFVPKSIASLLKDGQTVEPEAFDCVTVFFSDIVGFTSLSSESSPMEVIDFLSELYLCFDETLEHYDIFKVDTIGDAYIVASGLPQLNDGKHVIEIARAALELRKRIASFKIPHKPGRSLQMRVGINSGPCIAGIVGGSNMPKYCVFGDTLSVGKFMESSGLPMKIHITEESKALLTGVAGFKIEARTPKISKDGLPMQTYWLENDFE